MKVALLALFSVCAFAQEPAGVLGTLANNPLRAQESQNQTQAAQAAVSAIQAQSQQVPSGAQWFTGSLSNGRMWNSMSQREHTAYLLGILDMENHDPLGDKSVWPGGESPTVASITAALNAIYVQQANLNIPVVRVMKLLKDYRQASDSDKYAAILRERQIAAVAPKVY